MSCGGGCCQRKNYNSNKPLSKRIPQVLLVFFVVWLIGFGYLAQAFNQPTRKPKSKRRNNRNKRRGYHEPSFFEKFISGLKHGSGLIWGLLILFIVLSIILCIRMIRIQAHKAEDFLQNKWEEAMAQQKQRYEERMNAYNNSSFEDYDSDESYNGPRIRELTTEEEEAHWRQLIEKEKRERERQIAAAKLENSDDEEVKKTK
ncbi:hypothetical protein BCR32DRAFT_276471 [Anaeromyces robustus]|uniref:Uncharacterized protein n=1 Tax=Anaeromyces robustus TaxID=1754192 RepID=A0A1Y1XII0_9FUNG|nr:hypothetical protein BCR32DRAFT_276471 [Anaeromyces robustus]|eukprot:ORX85176.1 hypothetical protein BCR32DRAFT_276471 [Anaeromyces robustus]